MENGLSNQDGEQHTNAHTHAHAHERAHVRKHIHKHTHTRTHIHERTQIHKHEHAQAHTHTYTSAHAHSHSCRRQLIIAHDGGTLGLDWFQGCDSWGAAAPSAPILLVLHGINGEQRDGCCSVCRVCQSSGDGVDLGD